MIISLAGASPQATWAPLALPDLAINQQAVSPPNSANNGRQAGVRQESVESSWKCLLVFPCVHADSSSFPVLENPLCPSNLWLSWLSTKYQILKLLANASTYSMQISTPELSVKGDFISSMCTLSAVSKSYKYVSRLTPRAGGNSHPQPSDLVQRDWEKRTQSANPRYSVATNYTFMLFLCSISFSTPFLIITAVKKQIKHE